ncbi:hypothetical protein GBA65_09460 [Rubrobacter marinus]|uniref:Uncharacterized protein n=1 Tax=Rubrobacter marinus TaxID=2653852 RepID=A0A6G8PWZ3_9ACTN|nr:hypothetical protein [Rubrobacter marinus]QIN78713.1 hypothetical protein GBA65_09460 [Rubrobacter marinus]
MAVPVAALVWYLYGGSHAGALSYGVGVGILSFVSTAVTVSWLLRGTRAWVLAGAGSFVARYGFVAVALGVPAYLESWPALAMLGGFAGVFLAENVVLVPVALKMAGNLGTDYGAGGSAPETEERRVEV